jgi:large subunit ribosomal protein L25
MGEILHLTDLEMPAGVEVLALRQGEEHDTAVASIHVRKGGGAEVEEGAEEAGEEGGEAEG